MHNSNVDKVNINKGLAMSLELIGNRVAGILEKEVFENMNWEAKITYKKFTSEERVIKFERYLTACQYLSALLDHNPYIDYAKIESNNN